MLKRRKSEENDVNTFLLPYIHLLRLSFSPSSPSTSPERPTPPTGRPCASYQAPRLASQVWRHPLRRFRRLRVQEAGQKEEDAPSKFERMRSGVTLFGRTITPLATCH
jgi:hypothetical protein